MEEKKKQKIVRVCSGGESNFDLTTSKQKKDHKKKGANVTDKVSLDAQHRLMEIMNDSPRIHDFNGTIYEVKALKPKVQAMIAEEMIKLAKKDDTTMKDVFVRFSSSFESVVRCICLALLNDKKKIEEEYDSMYETLIWDCSIRNWDALLMDIVDMIDVDFFFRVTNSLQTIRVTATKRMMTMEEQRQLFQEQSSVK